MRKNARCRSVMMVLYLVGTWVACYLVGRSVAVADRRSSDPPILRVSPRASVHACMQLTFEHAVRKIERYGDHRRTHTSTTNLAKIYEDRTSTTNHQPCNSDAMQLTAAQGMLSARARARGLVVGARHICRCPSSASSGAALHVPSLRSFSSSASEDLVRVTLPTDTSNVAMLTLNRPPVNSLSMEMCQAISAAVKDVEDNSNVEGVVLASSNPNILSAGLDLNELYNPDTNRLPDFWNSFQQLFIDLYGSRLATVAAIEGHAPAAGCMLAICCDYRVMTDQKGRIGLNETLLGIAAPPWLGQAMVNTIGMRNAELSLSLGLLYSPQEALGIGLVDKVASADAVVSNALDEAKRWANIPAQARVASKLLTRQEYIDRLEAMRARDNEDFCSFVTSDKVQMDLGKYLEGLKKRTKSS